MAGAYPHFKTNYSQEELAEEFLLTSGERGFISTFRGDANRRRVAILLKVLPYLGYFPVSIQHVPVGIHPFISGQLGPLEHENLEYPRDSRTYDRHKDRVRAYKDWRAATARNKEELTTWLRREGALSAPTTEKLLVCACQHLRHLRLELPARHELDRIINSALNGYFQDLSKQVAGQIPVEVKVRLDQLLVVSPGEAISSFEAFKADARQPGVKNLEKEVRKLQVLRSVGIPLEPFRRLPLRALQMLKRRAANETATEMRGHLAATRHALLGIYVYMRVSEVTDDISKMAVELVQTLHRRTERQLERQILRDVSGVEGKINILYRIAEAVVANPNGTIREVLFPVVAHETFTALAMESHDKRTWLRLLQQDVMRRKYVRHYRRMVPPILEALRFQSDSRFQLVIKALEAIEQEIGSRRRHFRAPVPIEGVISPKWQEHAFEAVDGERMVNRHYYELCVLEKLQRGLKCKEIWVEGSQAYRNPAEDLPTDWENSTRRLAHYEKLGQPLDPARFIDALRGRMTQALREFDRLPPLQSAVRIHFPYKNTPQRGLFKLEKLEPQSEPQNLGLIKKRVSDRYGMLDLLQVFVEADRLVDFTRFFNHSGTKEVRSRDVLRPLLILTLFGEGTNTGIKCIANSSEQYAYEELLYIRKTYLSPEALRNANAAVVNKILEIRQGWLWGEGHACASDGKRFPAWSQNLITEWRSRYRGRGVLVYWHVETNAVCIYSQLRSFSNSEIAAMIEGLIRHDTEMRVEKNFVDSHGQSEVAFAICHLLGNVRLMPRLKRIKYERLYLPGKGTADVFRNLQGVLARPIRWNLIAEQYDEMIRTAVALKDGTAPAEAILRRFNSYNVTHPTYKALAEIGKAEKTIFLCNYLPSREMQYEVRDGLQVVENWNKTADFICYGHQGEIATNRPEQQEITALAVQLLQNCLMLINTLLIQQTIDRESLRPRLVPEDLRGLTPLFYTHINPYGRFILDLDRPSFLAAA